MQIFRLENPGQALRMMLLGLTFSASCDADTLSPGGGNEEVLVFGGEASYPPFEWLDQGQPTGPNVDLQKAIAEAGGRHAEHELGDWPEVIRDLKSGAVDVVAMFSSREREQDFRFTQPFSFVHHAIYGLQTSPNLNSVDDLASSRVAVEKLSYAHQRLLEMQSSAELVLQQNAVEALQALLDQRADYAVLAEPTADYLIKTQQLAIRPIGSPLWPAEYVFAVKKDRIELANWLDEQLSAVVESGRYREIQATWKDRMGTVDGSKATPWLTHVVLPLAALLLLGCSWLWSLRRSLVDRSHRLLDEAQLREQAESRLSWAADHYADTELPRQHHFMGMAQEIVAHAGERSQKQIMAVLKLVDVEPTIRSLGHEAGLKAVRKFAQHLRGSGLPAFGQLGRDVFVAFGQKADIERAFRAAPATHETVEIRSPYPRLFVGAATWPQHAETLAELLRKAETALSRAVASRESWVDFRPFMEPNKEELRLVSLFRKRGAAVISPAFQPQLDLASGKVIGAEALARWTVPGLGAVSPALFIPLLEDAGLMPRLTRRMITEAVRVSATLRKSGTPCPISVNVTGNDLLGWKLSNTIAQALREYGGIAADLKLELTETGVIDRPELVQWKMRRLVKDGIGISVDDFGTGYSSLAYLSDFPVVEIKIDQSFVRDMMREKKDMSIVTSTISMGHELGMLVVAEGVETEDTLNMLRRHGCDRAQGYVISRPLSEADLLQFVVRKAGATPRQARANLTSV